MLALPPRSANRVRPAEVTELRALAAIRRQSWWATYRGVVPEAELRGMDDARTIRRMIGALRSPLQEILVIEARGEPLGYAWMGAHRDGVTHHRGEIYELYLHPSAQRRGVGRQLLVTSIWALIEQGMHPVLVWVLAANPARHFYAACGGTVVGSGPVTVGGRTLLRLGYSWSSAFPLPVCAPTSRT